MTFLLNRPDCNCDWVFARCREYQAAPDGFLDLWAREHYKSTVITFAGTIFEILNNPNVTVGIFSHTRPIAKMFLRQIKVEFEENDALKALYPDVLWANPKKEAPKWSEDDGIVVRRTSNPKEGTVEASGLVDGQPTGKHYSLMIYDDVVTLESVSTPEMIQKVTNSWAQSTNLGTMDGKVRTIGTRYHQADTYREMMNRGAVIPRIYAATRDGTANGAPVFLTKEALTVKRKKQGPFVFACQMLQDPKADALHGFDPSWLKFWDIHSWRGMNRYIVVDPASAKKRSSDYTAIWVLGLGQDENFYIIDMVRDRMNLVERAAKIFELHREYRPLAVGYEKYGKDSDIEHFEWEMRSQNYHFEITELGGRMAKSDRIKRLVPIFEQGRIFLPHHLTKVDYEGTAVDLVRAFIDEEFRDFPVAGHDDMLDALSRILDAGMAIQWPEHFSWDDMPDWKRKMYESEFAPGDAWATA